MRTPSDNHGFSNSVRAAAATVALLCAVTALYLALPLGSGAVPRAALSGDPHVRAQQLADQIDKLQARIDTLQGRENVASADLVRKQARERAIAAQLTTARTRLAHTTKRLNHSRAVLSDRLIAVYKSGQPDVITVVLESDGFAEMLERTEYLKDVAKQDKQVIDDVTRLKKQTKAQATELASLEIKAQRAVGIVADRKAGITTAKNRAIAAAGDLRVQQSRVRRELAAIQARAEAAERATGGGGGGGGPGPSHTSAPVVSRPGVVALHSDGLASASSDAPQAIKNAVAAGNRIAKTPYIWGGGHGSFDAAGYDCSGSVSYVLHAAGVLSSPMASGPLMGWGTAGQGKYITVYANAGHAFMNVGGVWFDTSGRGATGSRWQVGGKGTGGFAVRHPSGL